MVILKPELNPIEIAHVNLTINLLDDLIGIKGIRYSQDDIQKAIDLLWDLVRGN